MLSLAQRTTTTRRGVLATRRGVLGLLWYTTSATVARADAPTSHLTLPPLKDGGRRLYLVRHGETDWNVDERIQGRTDNPLNANGRSQAAALSRFLVDQPLELITSSNLLRAAQTADVVASAHPMASRIPGLSELAEMCFGDFEGQRIPEIVTAKTAVEKAWADGDTARSWPGKGGESPDDVATRGRAGLRALGLLPAEDGDRACTAAAATSARHVLVVAHGRFNKILLAALQGNISRASEVQQGNTCINVLDISRDGLCSVRALDVRDHLLEANAVK